MIPDDTAIIPPVQQQIIDEAPVERLVEIPQRRMTERSTDVIPEEERSKLDINESTEKIAGISDPLQGMERETGNPEEIALPGDRQEYSSSTTITDEKITSFKPSVGTSGDYTIEKPYEISWEGFEREVQYDPLPTYPPGVNKEVRIKIRITVLPDGTVGDMIPLQKGDVTLETITMKALKQWRLNPLEPSASQVNQSGVVTFRFVLE
jgi:protein TonB